VENIAESHPVLVIRQHILDEKEAEISYLPTHLLFLEPYLVPDSETTDSPK